MISGIQLAPGESDMGKGDLHAQHGFMRSAQTDGPATLDTDHGRSEEGRPLRLKKINWQDALLPPSAVG
jgi:hypothetical protein